MDPVRPPPSELFGLILYVLAAVSGGIGGCGIASSQFLQSQGVISLRVAYLSAYAIIGGIGGILFTAYVMAFDRSVHHLSDVIPGAIIAGMVFSLSLAGTNGVAKIILRRLGIQIELTVRKDDEDRRG